MYGNIKVIHKTMRCCSSLTSKQRNLSVFESNLSNRRFISCSASRLKDQYPQLLCRNEDLRHLMEPFTYLVGVPKQQLRSKLVLGLNQWMNLSEDQVKKCDELLEMFYDYMIIYDDVLDNSELRRGIPAASRIYGSARSSMACSGFLFLIMEKLMALDNHEVLSRIYIEEMLTHYAGQSREMSWQLDFRCPTVDEYTHVIGQKTQSLCNLMIRIMQALSECKTDFTTFARLIGLYSQLLNDYWSLHKGGYWKTKGFAEDISEGRFSLAVIHAANSNTHEGNVILNIIRQKTDNVELKKYCLFLLEKIGSIEYMKQTVADTEVLLREEIERLGGNKVMQEILDSWINWKDVEIFTDTPSDS